MSSKTKIVVLHMKELIYTGIFAGLGILLIVLLVIMFLPKKESSGQAPPAPSHPEESLPTEEETSLSPTSSDAIYIPGIYTTQLVLGDQAIDVEVVVDRDVINSIRLVNLNEAVTTMYPLLEPTFETLCAQIYEKQSLENITYDTESKYTSLVLLEAVRNTLEKAYVSTYVSP